MKERKGSWRIGKLTIQYQNEKRHGKIQRAEKIFGGYAPKRFLTRMAVP
jgi:hypothetical protein